MGNVRLASALVLSVLASAPARAGDELGRGPRPQRVHETRVGGSNADAALDVCVDEEGCTYVAGWTRSLDFPGCDGQSPANGRDALLFKLSPDGQELLWSLTLGGRGDDEAVALALADDGSVFVGGTTHSRDFPTTRNVHDRSHDGGMDAFVARVSASGNLVWSTFLGGQAEEELADLALSSSGQVTLVGTTRSSDFPETSAGTLRAPHGARDVFVTRFDAEGQNLVFSARIGGTEDDEARALALDPDGACYVTGRTVSHDFPTTLGAFDRERCGVDAFVFKLSGGGRTLLYSTFLGGSGQDEGMALALDANRRAIVAGWTQSLDFPFRGEVVARGRKDGFVVALSSTGNALEFATPLGGGSADEALGVSLDPHGNAWIVGRTRSRDFQSSPGGREELGGVADGFLSGLSPAGEPFFADLFGGGGEDAFVAVHCDPDGTSLALGGLALDVERAERGPLSGPRRGPEDAFLLRLDLRSTTPTRPSTPPGQLEAGLGF
jgi:hypothetical protein